MEVKAVLRIAYNNQKLLLAKLLSKGFTRIFKYFNGTKSISNINTSKTHWKKFLFVIKFHYFTLCYIIFCNAVGFSPASFSLMLKFCEVQCWKNGSIVEESISTQQAPGSNPTCSCPKRFLLVNCHIVCNYMW